MTLTIKNVGGGTLDGTVSEACPYYSVTSGGNPYSLAAAESLVVTVQFAPTGVGTFSCTIETGDALCSDVEVTGVGAGPPLFVVFPDSIDFDRVVVGSGRDASFTVANIGGGTVDGNISEACSLYSILSGRGPFSLAANESLIVNIRYAPTVPGRHECIIETNASVYNPLTFVADEDSGLHIIDVGDPPAGLTLLGSFDTSGRAYDVFVRGDHAFVANAGTGPQVVDVSDPANPALFGFYDAPSNDWGVHVLGDHAYMASYSGWLRVIDVSNPAAPTLVGTYGTTGNARDVYVSGDYAFVANDPVGLQVIDISSPAAPTLAGTCFVPGSNARGVHVSGDHAYVADYTSGLHVIDISNPAAPTSVGSYETNGQAMDVFVLGNHAFVADGSAGLCVIDIINPVAPTEVGTCYAPGSAQGVHVSGGHAFLAGYTSGLHVIDINDPANPTLVSSYDTPGTAYGVAVPPGYDVACTGYAGYEYALIDSIVDVPGDQGGQVKVHMTRSIYDFAEETSTPIDHYKVWRRVDSLIVAAKTGEDEPDEPERGKRDIGRPSGVSARDHAIDQPQEPRMDRKRKRFTQPPMSPLNGGFPPGTWELVDSITAVHQQEYVFFDSTAADSTPSGIPYEVLVITAHTTTPSIWFTSPIDSGYSVDNLAPATPENISAAYNTGSGNQLTWDPSPEPDFDVYRIYRGDDESFAPDTSNLVHETDVVGWNDSEYDGWTVQYKITAVDVHGNESPPGSPSIITAVPEPRIPKRFALYQNIPNPFNPVTVIRYDVPASGGRVTLRIYDVRGRLVRALVNEVQTPGEKRVFWYGRNDSGNRVATGVYFYRMTAPGFEMTKKMVLLQ